jgi:hypothetical protein
MSNVSTKLIDNRGDAAFEKRKRAIIDAWRVWYHAVVVAMGEQVSREGIGDADLVSNEMAALQDELDHCALVGNTLFGFMDKSNGEAEQ